MKQKNLNRQIQVKRLLEYPLMNLMQKNQIN